METPTDSVTALATEIVSAYVQNNNVQAQDLPALIKSVRAALAENDAQQSQEGEKQAVQRPVSIKKSITPDYLISMEDGRQYRALKRHLASRGLTPQQYREKWGLPGDYPMTAQSYSASRSELAKSLGLGQKMQAGRRKGAAAKVAKTDAVIRSAAKKRSKKAA